MNDRTELILGTLYPVVAITVYKNPEDTGISKFYLESHDITPDGKIGAGRPLLQETIQDVVDVFFDERKNDSAIKGMLPDNLLYFQQLPGSNSRMIWYRPAEIRVLHHATQLKLPTNKCWVPALLYVVDRNELQVHALKSNTRPTEKTKLYKAPFFNVNDDGDVCLGSANVKKPKDPTYDNVIKYWEDLFWLSEFSHVNGSEKVKSKDLSKVYKRLLASKTKIKWSDIDELIPNEKMTLKNIL